MGRSKEQKKEYQGKYKLQMEAEGDQAGDENGNLPSSTIKIVKKNAETEAKLRMEGT